MSRGQRRNARATVETWHHGCFLTRRMTTVRVLIVVTFVLAFLAGRDITTVSRTDELVFEVADEPIIEISEPINHPHVDIYGNQVDQAVGDYRVDPGGDLYERHAPDTAVLKLGPPSV